MFLFLSIHSYLDTLFDCSSLEQCKEAFSKIITLAYDPPLPEVNRLRLVHNCVVYSSAIELRTRVWAGFHLIFFT